MKTVKGRVLIDTDVLIYATLEDDPRFARAKIQSIASLPTLQVLPLTGDAQLAATMIAHGIRTLLTENTQDFKGLTEIRAVNPFAA